MPALLAYALQHQLLATIVTQHNAVHNEADYFDG